jgi:hypothetical protein
MSELDKFFSAHVPGETVIGTYLYPYWLFDQFDWNDPYTAAAIMALISHDHVFGSNAVTVLW